MITDGMPILSSGILATPNPATKPQRLPPPPLPGGMTREGGEPRGSGLSWDQAPSPFAAPPKEGALRMEPATFDRLVAFLRASDHTGVGGARQALSQDEFGINKAAVEAAKDYAEDAVIGRYGLRGGWR